MTKWNTIAYYHVCQLISIFRRWMVFIHSAAFTMKNELRWKSRLLRFSIVGMPKHGSSLVRCKCVCSSKDTAIDERMCTLHWCASLLNPFGISNIRSISPSTTSSNTFCFALLHSTPLQWYSLSPSCSFKSFVFLHNFLLHDNIIASEPHLLENAYRTCTQKSWKKKMRNIVDIEGKLNRRKRRENQKIKAIDKTIKKGIFHPFNSKLPICCTRKMK